MRKVRPQVQASEDTAFDMLSVTTHEGKRGHLLMTLSYPTRGAALKARLVIGRSESVLLVSPQRTFDGVLKVARILSPGDA